MSSKAITLLLIALLFSLSLAQAARPLQPADSTKSVHVIPEKVHDEACEGVGEEECLMRRTLTAHVDYIYTQDHNP
uniref:Phytosulfokines n=1 Tax=Asparagus officinalis TaxID=4686 RepID=PSK_ASPOF|nr:RecName: Full=Phytosulfokines; Contains: RecName: Full=Phytosulfokine-alpha; Short=PSK-alpha; Short=Phytosulfokine-a; Contains: RecName: Full=Phytosulfokine-beta; Short=PSK-beta; Short=Phytosulfokine-b; Flags: Precursor [Asparagus officinalis]BAB20706.1 preprophytosulfokine [Asparagus officinalis]